MSTYNITCEGAVIFYFNLLINIYTQGVFVGNFFFPKGFVLLGGQQVYLSIIFKTVLKNGVCIIFGCTLFTSKYGIPTHNMQKLPSNTLWKKRENCAEIVACCFR